MNNNDNPTAAKPTIVYSFEGDMMTVTLREAGGYLYIVTNITGYPTRETLVKL